MYQAVFNVPHINLQVWRRSYDIPPPPLEKGVNDPMYPGGDPKYKVNTRTGSPFLHI